MRFVVKSALKPFRWRSCWSRVWNFSFELERERYIYIYIYFFFWCKEERERERERDFLAWFVKRREKKIWFDIWCSNDVTCRLFLRSKLVILYNFWTCLVFPQTSGRFLEFTLIKKKIHVKKKKNKKINWKKKKDYSFIQSSISFIFFCILKNFS